MRNEQLRRRWVSALGIFAVLSPYILSYLPQRQTPLRDTGNPVPVSASMPDGTTFSDEFMIPAQAPDQVSPNSADACFGYTVPSDDEGTQYLGAVVDNYGRTFAGNGTFIGPIVSGVGFFLTAGHIILDGNNNPIPAEKLQVYAGATEYATFEGNNYQVTGVYPRGENDGVNGKDIGLLRVEGLGDEINPVPLDNIKQVVDNTTITTSGWGSTYEGYMEFTMQRFNENVMPDIACEEFYGQPIDDELFCARIEGSDGNPRNGVLPGQSGGFTGSGKEINGVVSGYYNENGTCNGAGVSIYVEVSKHSAWISTTINENLPDNPPDPTPEPTPDPDGPIAVDDVCSIVQSPDQVILSVSCPNLLENDKNIGDRTEVEDNGDSDFVYVQSDGDVQFFISQGSTPSAYLGNGFWYEIYDPDQNEGDRGKATYNTSTQYTVYAPLVTK